MTEVTQVGDRWDPSIPPKQGQALTLSIALASRSVKLISCGDTGRKNHEACWLEVPVGASLHQANLSNLLTGSFFTISMAMRLQFKE